MRQETSLEGRRVLVSGGTTGIGRATVALLAREGARVLTFGRHEPELRDSLESARQGRGIVDGLTADAGTREGVERVFKKVDKVLGGLDILVACAALGADPLSEMAEDDWRYVVETNLLGYLACSRKAIDRMKNQGGGQLVLIGSISADIKAPGESVYAATKGGIQAFAETLRKEVAQDNIRVTLIEPGSVGSDMQECSVDEQRKAIAQHHMLAAEEIAEAIAFTLTRSPNCDIVTLRIEPRLQKAA